MNKLRSLPLAFVCGLLSTAAPAQSVTARDSAQPPVTAPLASQIDISTLPPLTINPAEPPTGTVGSAYGPFQFTASNGAPPLIWSAKGPLPTGLSLSSSGVLSGTPKTSGQFLVTLYVTDSAKRTASPASTTIRVSLARAPAGFAYTGGLSIPRAGHTATLLLTGKVLVAGGGNGVPDPTAELYDPSTGTFTRTTVNMKKARSRHTATLLKLSNPAERNYGKVLIVGSGDTTAELYDPATSTFNLTASLKHARISPTATLLNTGKLLIVGGSTTADDLTAELFDPASETFSFTTGDTTVARSGHTATLLLDGRVLIAGGGTATAELYDPASGRFTRTVGNMTEPRSGHTATLLGAADGVQSGHVLIIGGDGTADLYNPSAETFARIGSLLPYMRPSYRHTASLLNDGTVLVAGGYNYLNLSCGEVQSAENAAALFAPESDGFTATTRTLNRGRDAHTATVLEDGRVLVVGGIYQTFTQSCVTNFVLDEAELFQTGTGPALTGSCLGTQFLGYGCPRVQDSTQCPGGTLAIAPTAVRCTFLNPGYVDTARGCRARTSTGQTISGYCQIRYY